jgi:outer membrane protein OmpA-like peptidoglycan-associated protein
MIKKHLLATLAGLTLTVGCNTLPQHSLTSPDTAKDASLESVADLLIYPWCWFYSCSSTSSEQVPKLEAKAETKAEAKPAVSAETMAQAEALKALGGGMKVETNADGSISVTLPEEALKFAVGKAEVSAAGKDELAKFAGVVKKFNGLSSSIYGYTDNTGDKAANQALSQKRADAVKAELASNGLSAFAAVTGKGDADPIGDNATKEGRAKNRRVVVKLSK